MKQGVFLRDIAANAEEAIIDIVGVIGWQVEYVRLRDMLRGIPEGVKRVQVRVRGVERIIAPVGHTWDEFFVNGPKASDDFMTDRPAQDQSEREHM